MPSTIDTQEPAILIIPGKARSGKEQRKQRPHRPRLITVLFSLLAFIALVHLIAVVHKGSPTAAPPATCSDLIRSTDYTQVVHLRPQTQEMGAVQYVDRLVGGQPAVLVQVTNTNMHAALDVYVFGCTLHKHGPSLTTLFTQHTLVQGGISVSSANTLITSQLDTTLSPESIALLQPQQQNIYREYAWQNDQFVQTLFPSLYPVTSRSEAEILQQEANSGQILPWSDPLNTAEQMAKDVFRWTGSAIQGSVLNNNGIEAQVQLTQQNPAIQVTVVLRRLIAQNNSGLWFVVSAASAGLTLEQPTPILGTSQNAGSLNTVASPLTLKGAGTLPDGQISVTLFDHTLTTLSLSNNGLLNGDSSGNYTGTVSFSNPMPGQPGLLLLQSIPPSGSTEQGRLLLIGVYLR